MVINMAVKIGHASIDENGKGRGGKAGDQTGHEVYTRDYYPNNWDHVIRAKNLQIADEMADAMEDACANDNIGYDMNERTTLFTEAKKHNFDISKVNVKCETDCSALMAVCANYAGIKISKDIWTGNEVAAFKATGKFDILTDSKYLTSDKYLKRGDILVNESHHTAMVLTNGNKVTTSETKPVKLKTENAIAKEVIAGKWGTGVDRITALTKAGYDATAVQKEVNKLIEKEKTEKMGLKVGIKIKIKKGALDIGTGKKYASFVYNKVYEIIYIKDDYVAFGIDGVATGRTKKGNCIVQ